MKILSQSSITVELNQQDLWRIHMAFAYLAGDVTIHDVFGHCASRVDAENSQIRKAWQERVRSYARNFPQADHIEPISWVSDTREYNEK